MGNEQSGGNAGAADADMTINKGEHPPPLPLLEEAERALLKRHFPHAKRLFLSALESIIYFTGEDSMETARCRIKVGEMNMQEKKFADALEFLKPALRQMEITRKEGLASKAAAPAPHEVKKLIGDIAFCEYNLAQKEARGTSDFNKLSIAALQKFQALSEMNKGDDETTGKKGALVGGNTFVTDLLGQDFTSEGGGKGDTKIPETGGQAMDLMTAGFGMGQHGLGAAASGLAVARSAEASVARIQHNAGDDMEAMDDGNEGQEPVSPAPVEDADDDTAELLHRKSGLSKRAGIPKRANVKEGLMSPDEARAVAKRNASDGCGGVKSQADCNLIVASLYANTNNPVEARKVLASTAKMQRKRKVPVNATQRLAVGLDEQMRQLNALRLIQRGLMRILRRIRIRKIFRLQRELMEDWEFEMRNTIYEFEDDICYNWTGLEGDARISKEEEERLRYERIREEVEDLLAAQQMDYEDLITDAQMEFEGIMDDYKEFLADIEFTQKYDPDHWQRCIEQTQLNEADDRMKIRRREQEEWDALMQMMKISAMGAKRKEEERFAAYARIRKDIFDGLDAGADHIRKQEQAEWHELMNDFFEGLIKDLIEQERKARPKVIDLAYQREFWRNIADEEADERAEITVRDQQRARAFKKAAENLDREMMEALAALMQEEQDAWNKMMRQWKKETPQALKREEEAKKRDEVKAKLVERKVAKEKVKQQQEAALAQKLIEQLGNMNGLVAEERAAREIKFMKRRRSTKLPLSQEDLELLLRHFKLADQDESGDIDRDEFAKFCATVPTTKLTRLQSDELFNLLDKDGDGVLSFEEFCEIYDRMSAILEKPPPPPPVRRKSSVSNLAAVVIPAEPLPVTEEPLTPTEPVPLKQRRRSTRQNSVSTTNDASAFLLEDEPQNNEVHEDVDTTPGVTSMPVLSAEPTPQEPPIPAARRRSLAPPKRNATVVGVESVLPDDTDGSHLVEEDTNDLKTVSSNRRLSTETSPATETVTVVPQPPLPRRRSSVAPPRRSSVAVESQLLLDDVPRESIVEEESSLKAASAENNGTPTDAPFSESNSNNTARRGRARPAKSGTQETIETTMAEDISNAEGIDESGGVLAPPLPPATSSGASSAQPAATATSRRHAKSKAAGTQEAVETLLAEDTSVQSGITEDDSALIAAPRRISNGAENVEGPFPTSDDAGGALTGGVGSGRRKSTTRRSSTHSTTETTSAEIPDEEIHGAIQEDDDNPLPFAGRQAQSFGSTTSGGGESTNGTDTSSTSSPQQGSPVTEKEPVMPSLRSKRSVRKVVIGNQAQENATLVEDEGPNTVGESDEGLAQNAPRRNRSTRQPKSSNHNADVVAVVDSIEGAELDDGGLASSLRVTKSARRVAAKGRSDDVDGVVVEEGDNDLLDGEDEGLATVGSRRKKKQVITTVEVVTAPTTTDENAVSPKRTRSKHRAGASVQDATSATVVDDQDVTGNVEDADASSLTQNSRRTSRGGSMTLIPFVEETEDATTGEPSRRTSRSVSIVDAGEGEGSPSRLRRKASSSTSDLVAQVVDDTEGSAVVDLESSHLAEKPSRHSRQQSLAGENPFGSPAISTTSSSPRGNQNLESISSPSSGRAEHLHMLSAAHMRKDNDVLMKHMIARAQRTKSFFLTSEEVEMVRTHFASCDVNHDGSVSRDEFLNFADSCMDLTHVSKQDLEALFSEADANENSVLSFREFVNLYRLMLWKEVTRRDPSLEDTLEGSPRLSRRDRSANELSHQLFAQRVKNLLPGETVSDDVVDNLSFDPEFVKVASEWSALHNYVGDHPSLIGDKRVDEMEASLRNRAAAARRALNRVEGDMHSSAEVSSPTTTSHFAHGGSASPTSRVSSFASPRSNRKRSIVGGFDAVVLSDDEAGHLEESLQSLRRERLSNKKHRLLWDTDRPPWSLPAVDEVHDDPLMASLIAEQDQDGLAQALQDASVAKEKRNEDMFLRFSFLNPLPLGVPLSELGIDSNPAIKNLMDQQDLSTEEMQRQVSAIVLDLAKARVQKLENFVADQHEFSFKVSDMVSSEKTRRRSSRRLSRMPSNMNRNAAQHDSDSSSDDADVMRQKLVDEREADLNRRRQEIAQAKEGEAKRKAEQEEALRRQRESEAQELKRKNLNLRQKASSKSEVESIVKRCVIRAGKANSGEADLDINDLEVIKNHFDFCDQDESGGISRAQFFGFYSEAFEAIAPSSKKEIDELFKAFSSDGSELNFMEFVEVYKEITNREIQKKGLGRKKSAIQPRKPAEPHTKAQPQFRSKR